MTDDLCAIEARAREAKARAERAETVSQIQSILVDTIKVRTLADDVLVLVECVRIATDELHKIADAGPHVRGHYRVGMHPDPAGIAEMLADRAESTLAKCDALLAARDVTGEKETP